MTVNWDLNQPYSGNKVFVNIRGYINNPLTHQRAPFSCRALVDTGFTSGIFSEDALRSDAETIGVTPTQTTIQLGDRCEAYIEEVNTYRLPAPGKKVTLYMRGRNSHYIGMQAISDWIVQFHGPTKTLYSKF